MYFRFVSLVEPTIHSKWFRMSWRKFHKEKPMMEFKASLKHEYIEIKQQPSTPAQTIQRKQWRQLGDLQRLHQNLNTLVSDFDQQLTLGDLQAISLIQTTIQELQDKIRATP